MINMGSERRRCILKSIPPLIGLCCFIVTSQGLAEAPVLAPASPHSHVSNAGIIIFQDLGNNLNQTVTITSASLVFFQGSKSGDYCTTPQEDIHPLRGQYTFTLQNHLFAYQLFPGPVYKAYHSDTVPITAIHCLEFVIQGGDHTFSPQLVSFNIDCSANQQCIATSPAQTIVVSNA